LPPDLRKGFAFPTGNREDLSPLWRGQNSGRSPSESNWIANGKAEPFRTSGGEAAKNIRGEAKKHRAAKPRDRRVNRRSQSETLEETAGNLSRPIAYTDFIICAEESL
jgi:hypothetical protein